AAQQSQVAAQVAWNPAQLAEKSADASLVLLDLAARFELADVMAELQSRSPRPKVIAFGPHGQVDRLQAAAAAGCDAVLSRGEFHARLGEILQLAAG
ncbi:MAG: hypothetical protein AB7O62_08890, partial [Pirellulales bacterium]